MDRVRDIFVWSIIILALIFIVSQVYLRTSKRLEYRTPHRYLELTYNPDSLNCSRKEVRDDLNKLFGAKFYIYREKDLSPIHGRTYAFIRTVTMDDDISLYVYAFYLAHELVHLIKFTGSERYCNLIAFKTLYNTKKYRDVAIRYAIQDRDGRISKEYSCWEYIVDYLNES